MGYSIGGEGRPSLRQWVTERIFGRQANFITTDGNRMSVKSSPYSLSGKRKVEIGHESPLEFIYRNEQGETLKEGGPVITFDTISARNNRGKMIDYSLHDYRSKEQFGEVEPGFEYKSIVSRIVNKMAKKGFYPFGGTGDKDKIIFTRLHPGMTRNKHKFIKDVIPRLRGGKGIKDLPPGVREVWRQLINTRFFKKAEAEFVKEYYHGKSGRLRVKGRKREKILTKKELKDLHMKGFVSNVLYDLSMNGMEPTVANIIKMLGKGFIKDGTAFNKRMQIWMTEGYRADTQFLKEHVNDLAPGDLLNYILTPTVSNPKELKKNFNNIKNSLLEMHMDGAVLVRDDVINALNLDAGTPKSGQNKAFIVSPDSQHGALLGKFMFHAVDPEMSAEMAKKGLHMIIPDSAAKQSGTRKIGDYSINDDLSMSLKRGTKIYGLDPTDIRYNYGVKQGEHMNHPQRVFKQIWTAMTSTAHSPFNAEVVKDMFNSVIGEKFAGDTSKGGWNEKLLEYLETNDPKLLKQLERNIDKIGVKELLEAAHSNNGTEFADTIYAHMLKQNRRILNELVAEGELNEVEGKEALDRVNQFDTGTERMIKEAQKWARQERAKGNRASALPVLLHKYLRPYRMAVMQNYLVFNVTRPRIGNSAAMRMRPYDKMLQKKLHKLNEGKEEAEEVFYLDNDINPELETHLPGKYKKIHLKDLWNEYNEKINKKKDPEWIHKEDVEEIFRAAMVRIPMDSVSGTRIVKFGGYTGIQGHGVLLHGRIMEALGGADLDGDEAFVFFGGRKDGKGNGWKKTWKDEFYKNKDEYVEGEGEGRHTPDRKTAEIVRPDKKYAGKTFRWLLTKVAEKSQQKIMNSKPYQYSPYWRTEISKRAVQGREMLGGAVNMPQIMRAVHDVMVNSKTGKDTFRFTYRNQEYEVEITPRTQKEWLKYARQLASAQVAFAADPLDELGLKSYDVFFSELFDAHFTKNVKKRYGKRFLKTSNKKLLEDPAFIKKMKYEGTYKKVDDIATAYFSKNYGHNRRWTMHEIRDLTASMRRGDFTEAQMNTPMMQMAGLLHKLDWSDSVYKRVNKERLEDAYDNVGRFINQIPEIAKKVFNRKTFNVKPNQYIRKMVEFELWNKAGIEKHASTKRLFEMAINNTMFDTKGIKNRARKDAAFRVDILRQLSKYGEDFLINDISDMASIELLSEALSKGNISVAKAAEMHQFVEGIKKKSYLKFMYDYKSNFKNRDRVEEDVWKEFEEVFRKEEGLEPIKKASKAIEQAEIDAMIRGYRRTLSRPEKEALDMMLLGSYNRSNYDNLVKKWTKYSKKRGTKGPTYASKFFQLVMDASRTSTSMLGVNSAAVPDAAVRKYLGKFSEYMQSAWEKPNIEPFKQATDKIKKSKKVIKGDGSIEEGNILEETVDKLTKGTPVEDLSGYEGLSKGKLKPEHAKVVSELVHNLQYYNNKAKIDLNGLTRSMFEKDLNAMNLADFKEMNNYFKEARGGTIWQKLFGDKLPDMKKRYWWFFPKTVSREQRKYDILFIKSEGMYKTKIGEVEKGVTLKPTSHIEMLQNWIETFNNNATSVGETKIAKLQTDLLFVEGLGEEGAKIRDIAVRRREMLYQNDITAFAKNPKHAKRVIKENWDAVKDEWHAIKSKKYTITNLDGKRETIYGDKLVRRINGVYDTFFKEAHELMVGKKGALDPFIKKDKDGKKMYYDKAEAISEGRKPVEPVVEWHKFVRYVNEMYKRGKQIPLDFGVDGLRQIQRAFLISISPKKGNIGKALESFKFDSTGKLRTEGYWPHMFHSKKRVREAMEAGLEELLKNKTLSKEEIAQEYKNMQLRHMSLTGEFINTAGKDLDMFDKMMDDYNAGKEMSKESIQWVDSNRKAGSMHSRSIYIPGYSFDPTVPETYIRNVVQNYHLHLSQIMSRYTIDNFRKRAIKKGWDKLKDPGSDLTYAQRWQNWMKLYVQDSLGYPSEIPDSVYKDPGMKIKGTPYAWWADNRVKSRLNKIGKKLGLIKTDTRIPEELQGVSYEQLRHWSNLEAQFELASLLAHPKQVFGNIFGGSLHTISSAGSKYLRKARDMNYVKRIIPEVSTKEDLNTWVIERGVFPEFIAHELGLAPELRTANGREFVKAVTKRLTKTGDMPEETILELANKYKIKEGAMEMAARFMSGPEKMLRRDSFMAHYIRAWESFGGAIKDPTHPYLIELAKKGVKATQFLYNAPHRPAFARTALGKVMTRFQLWAWNAVRFRNDILREARIKGLKPGTHAFEKFTKTAQIDLMVLALGNVFSYSLFETAMPAPYNWLQDTSEWLFGDEKERDRAFFGTYPSNVAPLQLITPPILRMPAAGMTAYIEDDYKRLTDYYVYTMMPFGRIIRDFSPMVDSNLIDNPMRVWEKWAGMPMGELQRMAQNRKKSE